MVLWLVLRDMRPARHLKLFTGPGAFKDYNSGFAGPVVVAVLLTSTLSPVQSAGAMAIAAGMSLGLLSVWRTVFDAASTVVAVLGLVMVGGRIVAFLVQRRDTGLVETVFNLSVFVLICACFLGAAIVGSLLALSPWGQGLTTHALSFVVVLELLMLLADPAWDVLHTLSPVQALCYVAMACGIVAVLGVFSSPAVLDLLAVSLAITVAVYGTDLNGPQSDLVLVVVGIVLAYLIRAIMHSLFRPN